MQLIKDYPSDYTIIDLETTGLSPDRNSIIELSAIKVRDNKIVDKFTELVRPTDKINGYIQSLTGITNTMVERAKPIDDVLPRFMNFVQNDVVLGHNVKFDIRFVSKNLDRCFQRKFENDSFDTMVISRRYCTNVTSHKLSVLADYFNIDSEGHHRGLKDCEMTYQVYESMREKYLNCD